MKSKWVTTPNVRIFKAVPQYKINWGSVLFLSVLLLVISCSKSDGMDTIVNESPIDMENFSETFLENYEGTIWFSNNDYGGVYQSFLNSFITPMEVWDIHQTDNCYVHFLREFSSNDQVGFGPTTEIIRNSGEVFEYKDIYGPYTFIISTYTVIGDTMQVEEKFYSNGILISSKINFWIQSSDNVKNDNIKNLSECN